jgi:hypothetical protein
MGGMGDVGSQVGVNEMTTQLLSDPNMREHLVNMMTQPGMIDMIASSNPQLGQMINSMPMIRQTMQNPEMLRAMLNPEMLRMMQQLNPGGMVRPQQAYHSESWAAWSCAHYSATQ